MTRSFLASQKGSVMPLAAIAIVLLIGAMGAAVDMARMQIVRVRMQSALDAAGLAAGATVHTTNLDATVSKYFYADFPLNYMGSTITNLTASLSNDDNLINLYASATLNTTFIRVLGIDTVNVAVRSQITRQVKGMELVLAMDNTGSMSQPAGGDVSKIQAAKTAAQALLDILYGPSRNTAPNLWVGVVPFSQTVNIGTSRTGWLDGSTPDFGPVADTASHTCTPYSGAKESYSGGPNCRYTIPAPPVTYANQFGLANWQGCVMARSNGSATPQYDITDDPPSVKPFSPYRYPNDSRNPWYAASVSQTCTGGGCKSGHISTTCTQSYPACCDPNDESCVNQQNCGLPPQTYSCQQFVCDIPNPPATCGPATGTVTDYNYSFSSQLGSHMGPNLYCPEPLQQLVAEKNTVLNAINGMQPVGETEIDLGLAWAYRLLSQKWQGLWGREMDQMPYNSPLIDQVVILMTDGDNNILSTDYTAYGYPSSNELVANECSGSNCSAGITELNKRTLAVCDAMKSNGIIIYTVALGANVSDRGKTLLENCATDSSHYFLSPTTDTLQTVFQEIGDSLSNLRVSH